MGASRAAMAARSGSGPFGAVAQAAWFGQPAQASAFPACSFSAPGQSADRGQGCSGGGTAAGAPRAAALHMQGNSNGLKAFPPCI